MFAGVRTEIKRVGVGVGVEGGGGQSGGHSLMRAAGEEGRR